MNICKCVYYTQKSLMQSFYTFRAMSNSPLTPEASIYGDTINASLRVGNTKLQRVISLAS